MRFTYANGDRPLDGYTIKRGVGIGGFGEVYFATSDAGKEVALKRIQRNLDVEVRGVTQCLNLKHPNLIALYDIKYDDRGDGWIVMEYVNGESLKDVIERNPNGLPRPEALRWFHSIASGVAYLHDHGIVHRDLKPGNIFQDGDVVKIGDYGLSKFISCSRRSGQTESVGTFHYMAPEIGNGSYGKEIDIYALGIILYEVLTGSVPFNGETSQEIIMKHLTADPELNGIEAPYRKVVERALYKDPAKRFRDVDEMLRAMHRPGTEPRVETEKVSRRSVPPVVQRPVQRPVVDGDVSPASDAPMHLADEPLYITEENADEIVFGPVVEMVQPVSNSAARPPVRTASATDPEPIAHAVNHSWRRGVSWWNNANLSTPLKVLILVGGIFLLVLNAEWLVPLLIVAGAAYLVYFGIRTLVLALRQSPATGVPPTTTTTPPATLASDPRPPGRRGRRGRRAAPLPRSQRWLIAARREMNRKPAGVRLAELTGSYLMAAVVAAVLGLVMMILAGASMDGSPTTWAMYAWITISSVLGAWTLLAVGKFWESSDGDPVHRRFVLLVAGLLFGAATFGLSQLLMVRLNGFEALVVGNLPTSHIPDSMYASDGTPLLPAFLVYFGLLFPLVRWWKQSDPLRKTRLSVWTVFVSVVAAWLMHLLWQFPQPWGFMLAANISVATQLAAPWVAAPERERLREEVREAWEVA